MRIREFFLGGDFEGQALHAGAFELYADPGAQVDLAHYQDWGSGDVYDLSTRRVEVGRDARVKWVPIHLGGHLTKQTLDIITAEPGSDMRHTGMYFTERDEHLDLFTTDRHEAGHTTGDTVWKGALTGESRASYEGLIHILPKAPEVDTYLQTHQMLLSPKAKGDAIPSLIVEVDNVKASHGGTVGELDPDQIFYMMTRGIPRAEAVRVLVEGYFEEVVHAARRPGPRGPRAPAHQREAGRRRGPGERVHRGARRGELMGAVAAHPARRRSRRLPRARRASSTGKRVAYLDSAATSQKPRAGDRGDGPLPARVVRADPPRRLRAGARGDRGVRVGARERIAEFVGWDPACSIFTRNATEAINLVAYAWGRDHIGEGDEVLITEMEHHSNIVPWQILCEDTGAKLRYLTLTDSAELSLDELDSDPRRGTREARGGRARVERARHDQPRGRDRAARPRRRCGHAHRRLAGRAAAAGRPERDRRRLLRLDRPQGARADDRPAARPARAAGRACGRSWAAGT